jgi:hypothetical protein
VTEGPSATTGSSDEFASGPHAQGKGNKKPGQVGSGGAVKGRTDTPPDARTGREAAGEDQVDPQDTT